MTVAEKLRMNKLKDEITEMTLDKFGSNIMRQSYLHDNTPIYKKVVFIVAQKAAKKTIITIVTIKSPKNKKLDYIL